MGKRKSTMVELVEELRKLTPPESKKYYLEETIAEAIRGEYHDYKNEKYVCGKVAVVGRLHQMGFDALATRVIKGEFDEEADAQDKAMMKKDALAGGFSESQCKTMFDI